MIAHMPGPRTTWRRDDAGATSFLGRTIRANVPRTESSKCVNPSRPGSVPRSTLPIFTTKSKSGRNSASSPKSNCQSRNRTGPIVSPCPEPSSRRVFYFSGGGELLQSYPGGSSQKFRRGNRIVKVSKPGFRIWQKLIRVIGQKRTGVKVNLKQN